VRQIHPTVRDHVDAFELYAADARPASPDRPWVMVNMVASVDGATAVAGRSGALGGEGDRRVFRAVRAVADVIVAAAATVRAEDYGPPIISEGVRTARLARGQTPVPTLAVITNTLDLDPDARLFSERSGAAPPLVITSSLAPAHAREKLGSHAEIVVAGDERVDLPRALRAIAERGARTVLVEGGPSLNGQLIAAGLVDELCLTVSPLLVGGSSARIAHGIGTDTLHRLRLDRILVDEGDALFLRYERHPET
jgi:riboflavin-specific deaminase-like protein